jgi:hypothetical protein
MTELLGYSFGQAEIGTTFEKAMVDMPSNAAALARQE